jgi:hypothetical protein
MRATRRRPSTTEHGHAVSTREYQSDPWSIERPLLGAPRSPPPRTPRGALTEVAPYQELALETCPGGKRRRRTYPRQPPLVHTTGKQHQPDLQRSLLLDALQAFATIARLVL